MSRSSSSQGSGGWLWPVVVVVSAALLANWFPRSGEGTTFGQFVDGFQGEQVEPSPVDPNSGWGVE